MALDRALALMVCLGAFQASCLPAAFPGSEADRDTRAPPVETEPPLAPASAEAALAPGVTRRIVLRGVRFDFDRAELRPGARVILDAAADALTENPDVQLVVAGHTDSTGPEEYNQGLAERRARAVAAYLISKGISASRLRTVGYGDSRPVADNSTPDGRAQNRRVELSVLE
jgi:OOP family OmpA-OmpF porin